MQNRSFERSPAAGPSGQGVCRPELDGEGILCWGEVQAVLSPAEARILSVLLAAPARVVTRDELAATACTEVRRGLDTHIYRLRHKLRVFHGLELETVPKRGFRLNLCPEPDALRRGL
jgi:DNA-binding winged helix-turn-helix (wHTH) protein